MLKHALHAPETSARNHGNFRRLAIRLLVGGRRRRDARFFGRRSRGDEAGCG
jgi:hypothetical protein